jgi:hypothetical protein
MICPARVLEPDGLPHSPTGGKRRALVHYRCLPDAARRRFIVESYETLEADVLDFTRQGLALIVKRPLAADTLVFVELASTCRRLHSELLARVVGAAKQGQHTWLLRCELAQPLSDAELVALR